MSKFIQAFEFPGVTAVVVDVEGLLRDNIKSQVSDTEVRDYLPFLTSVSDGTNYYHIRNDSAYPVETKHHVIETGDTLCGRGGDNSLTLSYLRPTCPGCIAKAKNIIATHLLTLAGSPRE